MSRICQLRSEAQLRRNALGTQNWWQPSTLQWWTAIPTLAAWAKSQACNSGIALQLGRRKVLPHYFCDSPMPPGINKCAMAKQKETTPSWE
eukprot:6484759-Amphidinium_carterae.1